MWIGSAEQALLRGPDANLCARADAQLGQDVTDVGRGGSTGDHQTFADLPIAESTTHERGNFQLPTR